MKILVSWSSGKDSAWMLHVLNLQSPGAAAALLTTVSEPYDRVAMHGVRTSVLRAQAEATGLPLITAQLPSPCPNEVYEERMRAVVTQAVADGFTHVAFGDLFLEDVRRYREERLAGTGLTPLFPLWGLDTSSLARQMIATGVEATITCVDSRVLDRSFAGRAFDAALLGDLRPATDPCGERGEFHTCVTAGPMFSRRIEVNVGEVVEREGFVFADLLPLNAPTAEGTTRPRDEAHEEETKNAVVPRRRPVHRPAAFSVGGAVSAANANDLRRSRTPPARGWG